MAGENFLIGVEVALDPATQQITALTNKTVEGAREAEGALVNMGTAAERTAGQTQRSSQATATSQITASRATKGMADEFRGAGAAVSGVSAAMMTFGGPVGPIATVATSLGSLAASGAGPLGLAIAGVLALAVAFRGLGEDAAAAGTEIETIKKNVEDLQLQFRATASGRGEREQQLVEQIRELERVVGRNAFGPVTVAATRGIAEVERLRALKDELDALQRLDQLRAQGSAGEKETKKNTEDTAKATERILDAARKINAESKRAETEAAARAASAANRADVFAGERTKLTEQARREAARSGLLPDAGAGAIASQRSSVRLAEGLLESDVRERGAVMDSQRLKLIETLKTEREILAIVEAQVEVRRRENEAATAAAAANAKAREDEAAARLAAAQREAEERAAAAVRREQERQTEAELAAQEAQRKELSQQFRAPGEAFAAGVKSGLSQLLSGELEDPLAQLSRLMTQTMSDAVAEGLIQGLGLKQAAGNVTEGISNAVSGIFNGPTSTPGGPR